MHATDEECMHIPRNGIAKQEKVRYEEIRMNYRTAHLLKIYKKLVESPRIRFKDSVVNQLVDSQQIATLKISEF